MKRKSLVFLTASLSLAFFVACCCYCLPIPNPSREDVEYLFRTEIRSSNNEFKRIEFYIDGSESMKGFAQPYGNSTYGELIRELYRSFKNTRGEEGVEYYKFDSKVLFLGNITKDLVAAQENKNFYKGDNTHLGNRVKDIVGTPENRLAPAYIILTDGVQSEDILNPESGYGSDVNYVASYIAQWLKRGFSLHVYGFQSHFTGKYFSEFDRSINFDYQGSRPFYLFLFASDQGVVSEIESILLQSEISFNKVELPLDLTLLDWKGDLHEGDVGQVNLEIDYNSDGEYPPIYYRLIKSPNRSEIRFLIHNLTTSEARWLSYNKIYVDKRVKLTQTAQDITLLAEETICDEDVDRPKVYVKTVPSGREQEYEVEITLDFSSVNMIQKNNLNTVEWWAYRIRWVPDEDMFLPSWVLDYTTECDTCLSDCYGKTLNLAKLFKRVLVYAELGTNEIYLVLKTKE